MNFPFYALMFIGFYSSYAQNLRINIDGFEKFILTNGYCDNYQMTCPHEGLLNNYLYHPDGSYLRVEKNFSDSLSFYEYKLESCTSKLLSVYRDTDSSLNIINVYYIDFLGRFYFETVANNTYRLNRLKNIYSNQKELLFTYANVQDRIEDLIFIKDSIFCLNVKQQLIYHCDTLFNIIWKSNTPYPIHSFTAYPVNCDSNTIYCFGKYMPVDIFRQNRNTSIDSMYFFTLNIHTNSIKDSICNIKIGNDQFSVNGACKEEFLANDPECDLLIDLDRNNSSGLYPYDFRYQQNICNNYDVSICDSDVYVHTSINLDSIRMQIQGAYNFTDEKLISNGLPSGHILLPRNDSSYVLIPRNNNSDSVIIQALKSIHYINTSVKPVSGQRVIQLQGYNAIKKGLWISSFISIGKKPNSGRDTSLVVCNDSLQINATSLLVNADQNGKWIPPFTSGSNVFDSKLDKFNKYYYVTNDLFCGSDSATLQITRDSNIAINLPREIEIEEGEKKEVVIRSDSGAIYKINIFPIEGIEKINDSIYFIESKINTIYSIQFEDVNGCVHEFTMNVKVIKESDIYFPSAFSPNGDGINDTFFPLSKYPKHILYFSIFDRWGEQIFYTTDIESNKESQGWNGKFNNQDLSPGVYVYLIKYQNNFGINTQKTGNVTLMR